MPDPSVRDVAALARVSVGTVSNVLNRPDRVSEDATRRVHAAIAELGFVRNDAARQLRAGRSRSIGLIVLDAGNPFFTDLARGAETRAAEQGFAVLLGNTDGDPARESIYLGLFEEQRVQGVLISPVGDDLARLDGLRSRGIATVLVDRESRDERFASVSVDDVAGGRLAAEHLLQQGRRRIAFIGGPDSFGQVADRLAGARAAVERMPGATLEVVPTGAMTVLEGREVGAALHRRARDDRPDGIFCANDLLAVGVLQALVLLGEVRIPEEIALVGYDDIDFAAAAVVPLSSIRQPSALLGSTAVELLLGEASPGTTPDAAPATDVHVRASSARQVVFQPELVVRRSSQGG